MQVPSRHAIFPIAEAFWSGKTIEGTDSPIKEWWLKDY